MSLLKASLLGSMSVFLTGLALGSPAIPNWPAPATWSAPRTRGVSTLSETNPLPFQAVTPCRVADTRGNGFTGQYGPPSLVANATRSFTITGVCGIPASAAAVSFNFGALNVGGPGDLRVFPAGGSVPLVSTLNYNASTPNLANAAIVELGTGGAITVQDDAVSIDLIIDVNGYYAGTTSGNRLASGEAFGIYGTVGGGGIILGNNDSTTDSSSGVHGRAASGSGVVWGVEGDTPSPTNGAAGVMGWSIARTITPFPYIGTGVRGESTYGSGVVGFANNYSGLNAAVVGFLMNTDGSTASAGVLGYPNLGKPLGVYGVSYSTVTGAAGVYGVASNTTGGAYGAYGVDGSGDPGETLVSSIGVRGASTSGYGVAGFSRDASGVIGMNAGTTGSGPAGFLGFSSSIGVYFTVGLAGTGTKSFVEPHPTDPSKVIRYVSLEGPEAGTYFRGRAKFQRGMATIEPPEDFRMVTDPQSLSIQVTPIGEMASVAVVQIGLDGIVVKGSRDVEFFYLVNGVRRAYNHWDPIQENEKFFVPESPQTKLPKYLSEDERGRLIANGTYNEDGTVNMDTAERLGWAKAWADRETQAKAAAAAKAVAK